MTITEEKLYITAIKNLRKKVEYLQLCLLFETKQITEDEYQKELKDNVEKYCIDCTKRASEQQIIDIDKVIKKLELEENIDSSDVSEMFSFNFLNI